MNISHELGTLLLSWVLEDPARSLDIRAEAGGHVAIGLRHTLPDRNVGLGVVIHPADEYAAARVRGAMAELAARVRASLLRAPLPPAPTLTRRLEHSTRRV
jgi:hypothetical protein